MTREAIEFNYRRTLAQADSIDVIANSLKKLSEKEFQDTLQNLSANWKGENASLYLSKGNLLQEKMNTTVKELSSVASNIRTIAERIRNAELAALALALKRIY